MASCLTNDFIDKPIKSKAVALDADIDASTDTAQPAGATIHRIYCFATGSPAIGSTITNLLRPGKPNFVF